MSSHNRYGLVVTASNFKFNGQGYAPGSAIPDALERAFPRQIGNAIESGLLRRRIITGAQIAEAQGDQEEVQVNVVATVASALGALG